MTGLNKACGRADDLPIEDVKDIIKLQRRPPHRNHERSNVDGMPSNSKMSRFVPTYKLLKQDCGT